MHGAPGDPSLSVNALGGGSSLPIPTEPSRGSSDTLSALEHFLVFLCVFLKTDLPPANSL